MSKPFTTSLAIIGAALGFIVGLTIGFSINSYSLVVLYGLGLVGAVIGGISLSKLSAAINSQDPTTKKALTILCTIIAVILLALLLFTITMLNTYY